MYDLLESNCSHCGCEMLFDFNFDTKKIMGGTFECPRCGTEKLREDVQEEIENFVENCS